MTPDLSLYLVTDAALCGDRGVVDTVRQAVDGGVRIVQLREKHATDAEIVDQLLALSAVIDGRALLVVNDRLDAVVEARARGARVDGVHLGQGDAAVVHARALLGPDALIGLTANSAAHLDAVRALPPGTVDYLGVGVIRPTRTKPDHPPALGVDGFRAFAAASPLPCVAIGGVGIDDTESLRSAGAAGLAVVSALCAADDPKTAAADFVARWRRSGIPRVLSIAGSDPSGGAGIQADLKSISAHGGYGMSAITALTVQNTRGVAGVHVPPAAFLTAQLETLADDIVIDAVKIGMLADTAVVHAVSDWLDRVRPPVVVLDPVMVATSGDRLLDSAAEEALGALAARAHLLTPNLAELAVLVGHPFDGWTGALAAARELAQRTGAVVLVKGGHLEGDQAPDALVDANGVIAQYPGHRIDTPNTHGTGCSLSSAIATRLARGEEMSSAVGGARAWLRESLRASDALQVGRGHGPVHHFAGLWGRGGVETRPLPEEIAADWWESIAEVRTQIDGLPFVRALADGTLPRAAFLFYLRQDALYLREYARVLAEAARRAPTSAEQAFWAESAHGSIVDELALHASWLSPAEGVGAATFAAEPAPVTTAYLDHLRSTAFGGGYAELIAAILPCFWLYTDLGERLHAGDFGPAALDPAHPYTSWLATYADPAFSLATAQAVEYVTRAAATADASTRAAMQRAFTASAVLERDFFHAPWGGSAVV